MMRAVVVLLVTCAASPAVADVELEAGAAYGWFDVTESYTETESGDGGTESDHASSSGLGVMVGGTTFARRGAWRYGAFLRVQRHSMEFVNPNVNQPFTTSIIPVTLGPMAAYVDASGVYARFDVGTGMMISGSTPGWARFSSAPFGLLALSTEIGYEHRRRAGWVIRPALGLGAMWTRDRSDGDFGYYSDRGRLLTLTVVVSILKGP